LTSGSFRGAKHRGSGSFREREAGSRVRFGKATRRPQGLTSGSFREPEPRAWVRSGAGAPGLPGSFGVWATDSWLRSGAGPARVFGFVRGEAADRIGSAG
jgi:hypothetical protein